jgi:hypothetical protein
MYRIKNKVMTSRTLLKLSLLFLGHVYSFTDLTRCGPDASGLVNDYGIISTGSSSDQEDAC